MAPRIYRSLVRVLALLLVLGVGLGGLSLRGHSRSAQAQQTDRASVVLSWLDAEQRGDPDTAMAQFADNAVFIGSSVTGNCSRPTPCTDLAGIRQQIQGNIARHNCCTFRTLQVSGAVLTGQRELRSDSNRANGVERILQSFMAVIPQDKITFWVTLNDPADPQNALNSAINAGTQPAGTPLPNPTTPCAGLS